MCGIAGILHWGESKAENIVDNMIQQIVHRGPDGFGIMHLDEISLAHRRLSIIDLTESGKQPMVSNNRFYITYNGEIYNYKEIKVELKKKGYKFQSQSDTEVILKSYEEWGEDCLSRFNGMWAFAIWDDLKKELFASRDRFGQKPLYYYLENGYFSFASELKALLKDNRINSKISVEALNCYLAIGYILAPKTMYDGVLKLEAGSYLKIKNNGKSVYKGKYWNYADCFRNKKEYSLSKYKTDILELLESSVKYRMISDVPVGAFLSGGIDSSSICSLAKRNAKEDFHTFSIGFDVKSYSELDEANEMAQFIGTIHHARTLNANDNQKLMQEAINSFDEVFSDNSLIPMYEVSSLASEKVKVVISGDGADELFAGYPTYKADLYHRYVSKFPKFFRRLIANHFNKVNMDPNKKIGLSYKMRQFFNGSLYDADKAHYSWRLYFPEEQRIKLLGEEHRELVYDTDPYHTFKKYAEDASDLDWLDKSLYVDGMTWLTDDILVKVDRTTMRHSIEARAPFLDYRLAEYVSSIPSKMKLKGTTTKYILKKSLESILPNSTLYRKKSGFNAPVSNWMKLDEADEFRAFNKYVYNRKIKNADKTI